MSGTRKTTKRGGVVEVDFRNRPRKTPLRLGPSGGPELSSSGLNRFLLKQSKRAPVEFEALVRQTVQHQLAMKIREARLSKGMTQAQLAEKLEISQARMSQLERFDPASAAGTVDITMLFKIGLICDYQVNVEFTPRQSAQT